MSSKKSTAAAAAAAAAAASAAVASSAGAPPAGNAGVSVPGAGVARRLDERLAKLEEVEKKADLVLQHAANTLEELGKERTVQKTADDHAKKFINSLREVEKEMLEQLTYLNQVSCGHPYEGSSYAARLQCDVATEQVAIVTAQIDELIGLCALPSNGFVGAVDLDLSGLTADSQ